MLDPAFLRDNLEAVRNGLLKRGADLASELEALATLETQRRRLLPEIEGLKREQNSAGDEVARAKRQGLDAVEDSRGEPRESPADQAAERGARQRRAAAQSRTADDPEPAACECARRQEQCRQRRSATARHASRLGVHTASALGPRSGAGHHRLRARHEDRRCAVLGADGRRRSPRAGADQLHAPPAHELARVHGGGAALSRQPGVVDRNRQSPEVRGRPVQDCRRVGPVSDSDRRSAPDEHAPGRDSRRPYAADSLHGLHALLPERGRARTAPTCEG